VNAGLVRKIGLGVLLASLVVVIEMRYAEPILDGDLFWHFAYAQQMLDRHTLVPDATVYSWTPANHPMIYCAWLAELVLLGLYKAFGLTGLFALRYLVIAAIAGLYWSMFRRARFAFSPATLLAVLMLVVTAYPGSIIKPELFSLLFFHAVLWCYFRAKFAAREGSDPRRWLYIIPVLTLVWVNTHGGHILLAPLLAATAIGEILNWRYSPGIAFPGRQLAHLLVAWALCAVAVCITPYGIAYPLQNVSEFAGWDNSRPDAVWNVAHFPIYAFRATDLLSQTQLFVLLAVAVIVVLVVAARRRGVGSRVDFALLLSLIVYLPLSVRISRASYLWPAIVCYSLVYLVYLARVERESPERFSSLASWWRRHSQLLAAIAFGAVALRVGYDSFARPHTGSWLGFGVAYQNPVPEAEYLAQAKLGSRFYNTFDSGGYLLWRLYPQYKVMVDPRSFPYLDWFQDQYNFAFGSSFRDFLARYPADLAVIDLQKVGNWRNFVRANDWHLLFYGPTVAIFARGPTPSGHRIQEASVLPHLRNAKTAFTVFDFAVAAGDYAMAWNILAQLETTLVWQADADQLQRLQTYRKAHAALARGAYYEADLLFESALNSGVVADRDQLILTLFRKRRELLNQGDQAAVESVNAILAGLAVQHVPAR
jgi:hypothetical protein